MKSFHPRLSARHDRRSPCGERGLKFTWTDGAPFRAGSLPVRGAWIEMLSSKRISASQYGRSPCGERGLKCPAVEAVKVSH